MGDRSAPALSKREALSKMKTKTLHKAITAKWLDETEVHVPRITKAVEAESKALQILVQRAAESNQALKNYAELSQSEGRVEAFESLGMDPAVVRNFWNLFCAFQENVGKGQNQLAEALDDELVSPLKKLSKESCTHARAEISKWQKTKVEYDASSGKVEAAEAKGNAKNLDELRSKSMVAKASFEDAERSAYHTLLETLESGEVRLIKGTCTYLRSLHHFFQTGLDQLTLILPELENMSKAVNVAEGKVGAGGFPAAEAEVPEGYKVNHLGVLVAIEDTDDTPDADASTSDEPPVSPSKGKNPMKSIELSFSEDSEEERKKKKKRAEARSASPLKTSGSPRSVQEAMMGIDDEVEEEMRKEKEARAALRGGALSPETPRKRSSTGSRPGTPSKSSTKIPLVKVQDVKESIARKSSEVKEPSPRKSAEVKKAEVKKAEVKKVEKVEAKRASKKVTSSSSSSEKAPVKKKASEKLDSTSDSASPSSSPPPPKAIARRAKRASKKDSSSPLPSPSLSSASTSGEDPDPIKKLMRTETAKTMKTVKEKEKQREKVRQDEARRAEQQKITRDRWNTIKELTNDSRFHNWLTAFSKATIVPNLKENLLQGKIDAFEDMFEHSLGNVEFGAGPLKVKGFSIPITNVKITFETPSNVIFVWSGVSGSVKAFDWWYEKTRLPKISDKGQAEAAMKDTIISVTTYVTKDDDGIPALKLRAVSVIIGDLDVGISGSGANKIYKVVVSAMKKTLKAKFQNQLTEYVNEYFEDNARDWLDVYVQENLK